MLRIDRGSTTGPVFGYFRVKPQSPPESHVVVEHRVVLDHLDAIRYVLADIDAGRAVPIDTSGRRSAAWGQPWLSAHLRTSMRLDRCPEGSDARTPTDASQAYSRGAS